MNILKSLPREKFLNLIATIINSEHNYNLELDKAPTFKRHILQQGYGSNRASNKVIVEVKDFDISHFELLNREVNGTNSFINQRNPNRYIVIIPEYLTPEIEEQYKSNLNTIGRKQIEIWDAGYIDGLIERNFEVYRNSVTTWNEVYEEINKLLYNFYQKNNSDPKEAGEKLYAQCRKFPGFIKLNLWIRKFSNSYGITSLDPFHVLFSINAAKLSYESRIKRINSFLKILDGKELDKEVLFAGCPSPIVTKILSSRKFKEQEEIWTFFSKLFKNKTTGIDEATFRMFPEWNGIQIRSFTMFLFWFDSNKYLPLDSNVSTFIVAKGIRNAPPINHHGYNSLLEDIDKLNSDYQINYKYGRTGLNRELTHVAYQIVSEGKKDVFYSKNFQSLINGGWKRTKAAVAIKEVVVKKSQKDFLKINKPVSNHLQRDQNNLGALSFKLIAIRPLDTCDKKLLKILGNKQVAGKTYHFEKSIEISEDIIKYYPEREMSLYHSRDETPINVSAIVGKNGSGKSTLIELLFGVLNNVAFLYNKKLKTSKLEKLDGLEAELYYLNYGILNKILVTSDEVKIQKYRLNKGEFKKYNRLRKFKYEDLGEFFYTIAVNYSIYGLNKRELGNWIDGLFHKNDGYQTPIVINPMREDGVIDINKENDLLQTRFMANLLEPMDEGEIGFKQVTDRQRAFRIDLKRIPGKNKILYFDENDNGVLFKVIKKDYDNIWENVISVFGLKNSKIDEKLIVVKDTKKYIVRKLVRIALRYFKAEKYFDISTNEFDEDKLETFLIELRDNPSHITDKLMQAINYLKYKEVWPKENSFQIDLEKELQGFSNVLSTEGIRTVELIPPPIFQYKIKLKGENNRKSDLEKLSSGEKQLIHSTSSLIYHLRNIDSVVEGSGRMKYKNVHLCLDEIELYYHPEMQRCYLNQLLQSLKRVELPNIQALSISLVTHSPYILSDIPSNYTLRMGELEQTGLSQNTFGANIHQLLRADFFLENGFMGEFSQETIKNSIAYFSYHINDRELKSLSKKYKGVRFKSIPEYVELKKKALKAENEHLNEKLNVDFSLGMKEHHEKVIEIIGEEVLKNKLMEMKELAFEKKYD